MKVTAIFEALKQLIEADEVSTEETGTYTCSGELDLSEHLVTYTATVTVDDVNADEDDNINEVNWTINTITIEGTDEDGNPIELEFDDLSPEDQSLINDDISTQVEDQVANESPDEDIESTVQY